MKTRLLAAIVMASLAASASADVILQIGSFRNPQLAKTQVAEAALLGVKTHIVEEKTLTGQNGTQTYYRVRTGAVSQDRAERMVAKLRQNNIDVILFEAKKPNQAK